MNRYWYAFTCYAWLIISCGTAGAFAPQLSRSSSTTITTPRLSFMHVPRTSSRTHTRRSAVENERNNNYDSIGNTEVVLNTGVSPLRARFFTSTTLTIMLCVAIASTSCPGTAIADEYGVETEAPTMFTGEQVMICTKRGPLGACLQTTVRTESNDNDKAKAYFQDPSLAIRQKQAAAIAAAEEKALGNSESNSLIEKLRQQSIDNKEKNDLYVQRKTFENDQSATFGPFDRQVVIMNADERTYTLLQNPQAMRLKQQGFIEGRHFIKQPTQAEIDSALVEEEGGLANAILGLFGRGD